MGNEYIQPEIQNMKDVLEHQLGNVHGKDVKVYMDDKQVTLEEALSRCVQEQVVYMPDYVLDENGALEQVRFDRINL